MRTAPSRTALSLTLAAALAATPALAVPLNTLVATHGSLNVGGVTFTNFAIGAPPSPNPQGALPNDGADVDVSVTGAPGTVSLVFRMIDPLTGASRPLHIDAANGPHDLIRHTSFDAIASDPNVGLAAVDHSIGSGARASGDCSIVDMTYHWLPELPSGEILLFASLSLNGPVVTNTSPLLLADHTLARLDEEWELDSSHHGGVRSGTADLGEVRVTLSISDPTLGVGGASTSAFAVHANLPNPFVRETMLRFALPAASPATLEVFDVRGARLVTRDLGTLPAGEHTLAFAAHDANGSPLHAGTYFYRIRAGERAITRSMIVLE